MTIATVNPATGETVETFEPHADAEVARRIAEAADAAVALRDTTFAQRGEWMNATADIMEAGAEEAARMLTR
jgi:succinate-semialdehyde dehydrogenase / glutarate-semialdehyde dehydrogenase